MDESVRQGRCAFCALRGVRAYKGLGIPAWCCELEEWRLGVGLVDDCVDVDALREFYVPE